MNRNFLLIGGLLVGVLTLGLIRRGRTGANLNVTIDGVEFDFKNRRGFVYVVVINPLRTPITINSIVADVIYNGSVVGTLNYTAETTIQGLATTRLKIPIQFSFLGNLNILWELYNQGKKVLENAEIKIKGNVNSGGLLFPIDYGYKFK
jgi:hypothetical protein